MSVKANSGFESWRCAIKNKRSLLLLLLLQILLVSAEAKSGMFDFFKRYEVHLSPEVHGRVTFEGKPVADIEVYRTLDYGKEYVDKTKTDSDGSFRFSEKNITSNRPGKLLDETRVRQVIGALYQGENYLLWYTVLGGITPRKTLSEKLSSLECELTKPEKEHVFVNHENPSFPHGVFSICRWDNG